MRVAWMRPALRDLDQIQDFIANESPVAAYKLTSELMGRSEKMLATNPRIGRKGRAQGTRELVISGTPYIVVYRVRQFVEIRCPRRQGMAGQLQLERRAIRLVHSLLP